MQQMLVYETAITCCTVHLFASIFLQTVNTSKFDGMFIVYIARIKAEYQNSEEVFSHLTAKHPIPMLFLLSILLDKYSRWYQFTFHDISLVLTVIVYSFIRMIELLTPQLQCFD